MTFNRNILESGEQILDDLLETMFNLVEDAIEKARRCLADHDVDTAAQVVDGDEQINALQHKIDELCIQTIALQQPVARDLRRLMADIYISMELERIADHAVAVAEIILKLDNRPDEQQVKPIIEIADKCRSMFTLARKARDEEDEALARNVAALDDEIDSAELDINELMFDTMRNNPGLARDCTRVTWITHNLERIGDRITNIVERVVYMKTNVTPELNH